MNTPASSQHTAQVIPLYPDDDPAADQRLRTALRQALQAPTDAARLHLEQQVLADWQRLHRPARSQAPRPASAPRQPRRAGLLGGMPWHRGPWAAALPAWVGAACLVMSVALAYSLWLRHATDPALEELAQVDVLSQMAAGEM